MAEQQTENTTTRSDVLATMIACQIQFNERIVETVNELTESLAAAYADIEKLTERVEQLEA